MASGVDSIQGFSRTPRITPKSKAPVDIILVLIPGNIRILIAAIRNLGKCPCPQCLIPLNRVHNLGMPRDMMQRETLARVDNLQRRNVVDAARRVIYDKNFQVNSTGVENILQATSLVPTAVCCAYSSKNNNINKSQNAFSDRLLSVGFNFFSMLLPDVMHEIEIGGWRALFIHLLRILESVDGRLLVELDRR